ncbi:hypothetical protein [Microbulbifer sp. ZKSA002]|uniref:hypothetical protein n=1 Tax=Microbulbifer sp. ZKSA002 TaxID=3243388 RepID=UPI0040399576
MDLVGKEIVSDAISKQRQKDAVSIGQNPTLLTPEQEQSLEVPEPAEENSVGFIEAFGTAAELDWTHSRLARWSELEGYEEGSDFTLSQSDFHRLGDGLADEHKASLVEATSLEHAENMREELLATQKLEQVLMQSDSALSARILANLVDPTSLVAGTLTGGVGTAVMWGSRVSRVKRAFTAGAITAGEVGTIESLVNAIDPVMDDEDVLLATATAGSLGGLIGSFGKVSPDLAKAYGKVSREVEAKQLKEAGEFTEEGKKSFEDVEQPLDLDNPGHSSTSSATTPTEIGATERVDIASNGHEFSDKAFGSKVNYTIGSLMAGSDNSLLRHWSSKLVDISTGWSKRGTTSARSASGWKRHQQSSFELQIAKAEHTHFNAWKKEHGFGAMKETQARNKFYREVSDYIEGVGGDYHPAVKAVGDVHARIYRELGELQKNPLKREGGRGAAVRGAENFEANAKYLPHVYDDMRIERMGRGKAQELLARGIAGVTEDVAQRVAKNVVKIITSRRYQTAGQDWRKWFEMDAEDFRYHLEEAGIDGRTIDELAKDLQLSANRKEGKAGKESVWKQRINLDMNARLDDGTAITELFQRNADVLLRSYMNRQLGKVALARHGLVGDSEIAALRKRLEEQYHAVGATGKRADWRMKAEMDAFQKSLNHILGIPNHDGQSLLATTSRLGRKMAFGNVMGMVGFAQIAEIGNVVATMGFKGFFKSIPEWKSILLRARNGELSNDLAAELEEFTGGYGSQAFLTRATNYDPEMMDSIGDGLFGKVERGLDKANRGVATISGMNLITTFSQRLAVKGQVDRVWKEIHSNIPALSERQLREYGITPEEFSAIKREMSKHAKGAENVHKLNWESWEPETAEAFATLLRKWGERSVQVNDIGDLLPFDSPLSKLLLQFRTFVISAHSKQLLNTANQLRDGDIGFGVTKMLYGSLFASLGYIARTHTAAVGRPDREEYLKEKLTNEEVIKAGFARASWAALLPAFADTGADFFGEPLFNQRYTGLENSLLNPMQSPAGAWATNAVKLASSIGEAAVSDDKEFTEKDLMTLKRLMIMQNAPFIDGMLRNLVDNTPLPEE